MLEADTQQIIEVANKLEGVGNQVDDLDIRSTASPVLPGTDISALCAELAEKTEGAYLRVAERMKSVAASMRTCAAQISMTDSEFASKMNEMDYTAAQS
ncbi:hypothetical protein [Nocardia neocaledoniensis]|uniref:hypothetical protein n=1 Tax=Nocardia neocaledoniensis TaxID=236511 RepID=UPI002457B516|nr:hypothetical protein [Nocardia neocaledoniensis]